MIQIIHECITHHICNMPFVGGRKPTLSHLEDNHDNTCNKVLSIFIFRLSVFGAILQVMKSTEEEIYPFLK